jgi:pyruvate/2-oxoglutarate dehydrogenase complex dihydrolipoamide dehydrogenase (E3) component
MSRITTDICVIGGGSGGLSVAAGAVQMGARVVLIEGHKMGGDCLNYGCVPSKALLAAGKAAQAQRDGAKFGIKPVEPQIDYAAAKDHVARTIATIEPHDSVDRFRGLGVQVLQGYAGFISPTEVQVDDTIVTARRFVIATGSSPFVPPIPGIDTVPYETNETIFALRERPEHLLVIGGGPIGLEMAQAHSRLGCAVTVIEGAKAFGRDDPEAAAVVVAKLRDEGIVIVEDAMVELVRGRAGAIEVQVKGGTIFHGTHLLMAVGRKPNLDKLNLDVAGIKFGRAAIEVGADLRTTNSKVYAIGDVAGQGQFTHVAGYHAGVIIRSMLFGLPSKTRTNHIPYVTYTDPELAQVGLTEAQARTAHGDAVTVVRFNIAGLDRALAEGKTDGFIKVMVLKGRPIGATIVGAQAGEMLSLWAMAIANNMKMSAIAATVIPYPTLAEISKRATGVYFSPKLFDNPMVKRVVRLVQKFLP